MSAPQIASRLEAVANNMMSHPAQTVREDAAIVLQAAAEIRKMHLDSVIAERTISTLEMQYGHLLSRLEKTGA